MFELLENFATLKFGLCDVHHSNFYGFNECLLKKLQTIGIMGSKNRKHPKNATFSVVEDLIPPPPPMSVFQHIIKLRLLQFSNLFSHFPQSYELKGGEK